MAWERDRLGVSRRDLAARTRLHPAYLTLLEQGSLPPEDITAEVVESLRRGLAGPSGELALLPWAKPPGLDQGWGRIVDALRDVGDRLTLCLSPSGLDRWLEEVNPAAIGRRWGPVGPSAGEPAAPEQFAAVPRLGLEVALGLSRDAQQLMVYLREAGSKQPVSGWRVQLRLDGHRLSEARESSGGVVRYALGELPGDLLDLTITPPRRGTGARRKP